MDEERRTYVRRWSDRERTVTGGVAALPLPGHLHRVSWGAIFAGAFVGISLQILFTALGLGIGLGVVQPSAGSSAVSSGLGIGAAIWWIVTGIISLFVGGWAAGRLAGTTRRLDGGLHGLVTWGLATVFSVYLLTSAVGGMLGGAWSTMSNQIASRGQQVTSQIQGAISDLQQQAQNPDNQQAAKENAAKATSKASGASFGLFVMLLLGAGAAYFGGASATPRDLRRLGTTAEMPRSAAGM